MNLTIRNNNRDNPALMYVMGLKKSSRRVQTSALNTIAKMVNPELDIYSMPWGQLRYKQTAAIAAAIKEEYAASTANRYISALKGVMREAWRLGLVTQEEMARAIDLKSVKDNSGPAGRALKKEELSILLGLCETDTAYGLRDYAIMSLMWQCGLRRAEVVGLNIGDIDTETGRIEIKKGKGNKDRVVFANGKVLSILDKWIELRSSNNNDPLFTTIDSNFNRLSTNAIYYMVNRYCDEAGIDGISPHSFRRAAITEMLDAGTDLLTVQKISGHAKAETVMKYDRRGEDSLADAASKMIIDE